MEIWKEIKGYEGLYEVSSEGRVRSLDRWVVSSRCRSWMKGKHHTKESKEKNRQANIGKTPWNKGLHITKLS